MAAYDPRRGYLGRLFILTIGAGAIGCSILTTLSCDFIGVEKVQADDAFPDSSYLKEIGIFYFSSATESCSIYNTQLIQTSKFNRFFIASQIASLSAPLLGLIGWALVLSEVTISCCRFQGSFVLQNLLFLCAFVLQCCTFLILGQTKFCFYDGTFNCQWGLASMISIASASLYYFCSVLLCCLPRPNAYLDVDNGGKASVEDEKV